MSEGDQASGRFLAEVGLPMPILNPEHAIVIKATAGPVANAMGHH